MSNWISKSTSRWFKVYHHRKEPQVLRRFLASQSPQQITVDRNRRALSVSAHDEYLIRCPLFLTSDTVVYNPSVRLPHCQNFPTGGYFEAMEEYGQGRRLCATQGPKTSHSSCQQCDQLVKIQPQEVIILPTLFEAMNTYKDVL